MRFLIGWPANDLILLELIFFLVDIWLFPAAMVALTESICWKTVVKTVDSTGIGVVIYQKPVSNSCYSERKAEEPAMCDKKYIRRTSWYSVECYNYILRHDLFLP